MTFPRVVDPVSNDVGGGEDNNGPSKTGVAVGVTVGVVVGTVLALGMVVVAIEGTVVMVEMDGAVAMLVNGAVAQTANGVLSYEQMVAIPEFGEMIATMPVRPVQGWVSYDYDADNRIYRYYVLLDFDKAARVVGANHWKVMITHPSQPGLVVHRQYRGGPGLLLREHQNLELLRGGNQSAPVLRTWMTKGEWVSLAYDGAVSMQAMAHSLPDWALRDSRIIGDLIEIAQILRVHGVEDFRVLYDADAGSVVLADPWLVADPPEDPSKNFALATIVTWLKAMGVQGT